MAVTLRCDWCGKPFPVCPAHARKRRFCSPSCRGARKQSEHLTCDTCGARFRPPPSKRARGARYCSRVCSAADKKPLADRLWPKVRKGDGCWEFIGHRDAHGYGRVAIGTGERRGLSLLAHRVAWELTNGPIPADRHVLHRCDNPPCVRPDHLFLGDQRANNTDRDSKGRVRHGSTHRSAKLTEHDVSEIRMLAAAGLMTQRQIAELFGVSHGAVSDLLRGLTWKRA